MIKPIEPVQILIAVKPDSNMIGLVEESVLPNTSKHLAPDKAGLDGVILAVAAHNIIHKGSKIVPDEIKISGEQAYGMFVYVELMYKDKPPEGADYSDYFLFHRKYKYLIDTYSQSVMLVDTKF